MIPAKIQATYDRDIAKLWPVNFSFPQQTLSCFIKSDNTKFYSVILISITPNWMSASTSVRLNPIPCSQIRLHQIPRRAPISITLNSMPQTSNSVTLNSIQSIVGGRGEGERERGREREREKGEGGGMSVGLRFVSQMTTSRH